jgi:hypothetical protein
VQGKATERDRLPAETADSFEWPCSEVDIAYWLHGTAPVLLIVVQTKTNRAYWKSIKDYFRDANAMQSRRVVFEKRTDVFDRSAKAALSMIAASVVVTIWCTLRGWPRDEQRTAFQPIGVGVFLSRQSRNQTG